MGPDPPTMGWRHKAQIIDKQRVSALYTRGSVWLRLSLVEILTEQGINLSYCLSHGAIAGPIVQLRIWFPKQPSRLGSGLEAFSRNPSSGSVTALSDRTTVDTRDSTWEFLSYYPRLLSSCTGPRAHSPSVG